MAAFDSQNDCQSSSRSIFHSLLATVGTRCRFTSNGSHHENLADEREVANFIDDTFWGFGPKQSRNLLQMLGLTRYVIPIDSRVLKWMNDIGFPIPSSSGLLAYRDYFEFIEDGLNELCSRAGIHPCILDAAVFGSFDGDNGADWTEEMRRGRRTVYLQLRMAYLQLHRAAIGGLC